MPEATLYELLEDAVTSNDESMSDIESVIIGLNRHGIGPSVTQECALDELREYTGYTGYGGRNFPGLFAWSKDYVYLKGTYDGSEWVDSVPRNPTTETEVRAVGGG